MVLVKITNAPCEPYSQMKLKPKTDNCTKLYFKQNFDQVLASTVSLSSLFQSLAYIYKKILKSNKLVLMVLYPSVYRCYIVKVSG